MLTTFDENASGKPGSEHGRRAIQSARSRTANWLSPKTTKSPPPLRWWGIPPTREGLLSNDLAISCGSRRRLSASSPCEAALTATLSDQGPCYPGSQDQEHQSQQV